MDSKMRTFGINDSGGIFRAFTQHANGVVRSNKPDCSHLSKDLAQFGRLRALEKRAENAGVVKTEVPNLAFGRLDFQEVAEMCAQGVEVGFGDDENAPARLVESGEDPVEDWRVNVH